MVYSGRMSTAHFEGDADSALRRSQRLLEAISDNSSAVIYAKDLAGRYLFVNRRFGELFRVGVDSMLGKTDYDLFSAEQAEHFRGMDQRVAAGGDALTGEETVPLSDGVHTYLSVKSPLRDDTGRVYAVFGVSTDITDRKRTEEALRATEDRTRLIVDTALDAVVTMDAAGVITGWNPQAEQTFGWRRAEVLGRSMADTVVPDSYRDAHRRGLERYLSTGVGRVINRRLELSALHRDGHEFPIELSITPLENGGTISFSAFVRDITDRYQAERRLHEQVERLNLLDQLTRAIGERQDLSSILQVVVNRLEDQLPADFCCACLYDRAGASMIVAYVGVRSAPLAAELALAERARIPVDQNGLSQCAQGRLVHEADLARIEFPFAQRLARSGLRSLVAAPLIVESQVFAVLIVARREGPGFSSVECEFLRQLSEHVALAARQAQLYSALQQAYDDLRQTQQVVAQQDRLKALGQMASGIAHDINNAITPLAISTEMLLETEPHLSAEARATLVMMQHAIEDVAHTVSGLRGFYRERESQPALTAVDLDALLKEVVALTRARWSDMPQERGVAIAVSTEAAPDALRIDGVESELRQALINLVFNAVDAMPDGGALTLRTRVIGSAIASRPPDRIAIEVADTGIGMSAEIRQRCLEPFFTTKGERGTGLGLAMVYGVVQRHNADIELDSEVGKGTTVRLTFAIPAAVAAESTTRKQPPRVSHLRLLVIDDDPMVLKSMRAALEVDHHVVTTEDGGQAGIDAFRRAQQEGRPFAAVITDLGMPYVDGRRVAAAIKEEAPHMPVILLTGWGQRMLDDSDVPSSVDRVLAKPPRLADLRLVLTQLTSSRSDSSPPGL
jgi:PAS domain S-box-containing protein